MTFLPDSRWTWWTWWTFKGNVHHVHYVHRLPNLLWAGGGCRVSWADDEHDEHDEHLLGFSDIFARQPMNMMNMMNIQGKCSSCSSSAQLTLGEAFSEAWGSTLPCSLPLDAANHHVCHWVMDLLGCHVLGHWGAGSTSIKHWLTLSNLHRPYWFEPILMS